MLGTPAIPAFRKLGVGGRGEDHLFKTNLEDIARPCLNKSNISKMEALVNAAQSSCLSSTSSWMHFSVWGKKGLKASILQKNLRKNKNKKGQPNSGAAHHILARAGSDKTKWGSRNRDTVPCCLTATKSPTAAQMHRATQWRTCNPSLNGNKEAVPTPSVREIWKKASLTKT